VPWDPSGAQRGCCCTASFLPPPTHALVARACCRLPPRGAGRTFCFVYILGRKPNCVGWCGTGDHVDRSENMTTPPSPSYFHNALCLLTEQPNSQTLPAARCSCRRRRNWCHSRTSSLRIMCMSAEQRQPHKRTAARTRGHVLDIILLLFFVCFLFSFRDAQTSTKKKKEP